VVFYSNSTTKRLEGYARARGKNLGIVISPDNSGGRYFVVSVDNEAQSTWYGLGRIVMEAQERIDRYGQY